MKKLRNILCAVFALLLAVSFSACSKAAVDETTEDGAEADTQITVIAADGTTHPHRAVRQKIRVRRTTMLMFKSRKTRPAARVSAKPCASR